MTDITKFILSKYKYSYMVWPSKTSPSYEDFYNWNIKCISESPDEAVWLNELCTRMASSKVKLMDEDSNTRHDAYAFYFDYDKNIVLCSPMPP
jgi:hypothetical protein